MDRNGLNASEVARRMWGTTKDKRGYDVARNRDRIGHYLNGTSYPEPANLELLAQAVGVSIETLMIERPEGSPAPRAGRSPNEDMHVIPIPEMPGKVRVRLQVDRVVAWDRVATILEWLQNTQAVGLPIPGTVINGGNGNSNDDTDAETA